MYKIRELRGIRVFVRLYKLHNAEKKYKHQKRQQQKRI